MKKILIVDDDKHIRALVSATIERDELEILEAEDGEKALEIINKTKPDLVILDVTMPKKNGLEVCRIIKSQETTRHIYVIMLTGKVEESDLQKGKEAGADEYFIKPFSPLALLHKIDEILN